MRGGDVGGDLEREFSHPVQEDMALQRATWTVQRIGWVALALLSAAALLGVFATGPLASAVATGGSGLEVRYGRFERSGASTRIELTAEAGAAQQVVLRLGAAFLDAFTVTSVHPQPAEERSGPDGAELIFRLAPAAPLRVHLEVLPMTIGTVRSEISVAGAGPARLVQFIYP